MTQTAAQWIDPEAEPTAEEASPWTVPDEPVGELAEDASPEEQQQALELYKAKAEALIPVDDLSLKSCVEFEEQCKAAAKRVEEKRKTLTDPLVKQKKEIDAIYTPVRDAFQALAQAVGSRAGAFIDERRRAAEREQQRLIEEANRKKREEEEKARKAREEADRLRQEQERKERERQEQERLAEVKRQESEQQRRRLAEIAAEAIRAGNEQAAREAEERARAAKEVEEAEARRQEEERAAAEAERLRIEREAEKLEAKAERAELKAAETAPEVVDLQSRKIDLGDATMSYKDSKPDWTLAGWDKKKPLPVITQGKVDHRLGNLIGDLAKLPEGVRWLLRFCEINPVALNKACANEQFPEPFTMTRKSGGSMRREKGAA